MRYVPTPMVVDLVSALSSAIISSTLPGPILNTTAGLFIGRRVREYLMTNFEEVLLPDMPDLSLGFDVRGFR